MKGDHQEHPLTPEQALKIFKMYEDKGWEVKKQMLTSVSWLTPFVFGLIAFAAQQYASDSGNLAIAVAAIWAAFALSLFIWGLVRFSLLHANDDYERSHKVLQLAKNLLSEDIVKVLGGGPI